MSELWSPRATQAPELNAKTGALSDKATRSRPFRNARSEARPYNSQRLWASESLALRATRAGPSAASDPRSEGHPTHNPHLVDSSLYSARSQLDKAQHCAARCAPSLSLVPLAGVDGSAAREGLWASGAADESKSSASFWRRPHEAHRSGYDGCTQRRARPPTNRNPGPPSLSAPVSLAMQSHPFRQSPGDAALTTAPPRLHGSRLESFGSVRRTRPRHGGPCPTRAAAESLGRIRRPPSASAHSARAESAGRAGRRG